MAPCCDACGFDFTSTSNAVRASERPRHCSRNWVAHCNDDVVSPRGIPPFGCRHWIWCRSPRVSAKLNQEGEGRRVFAGLVTVKDIRPASRGSTSVKSPPVGGDSAHAICYVIALASSLSAEIPGRRPGANSIIDRNSIDRYPANSEKSGNAARLSYRPSVSNCFRDKRLRALVRSSLFPSDGRA